MVKEAIKKTVLLIGTGGTISALGADPLDFYDYPMTGKRLSAEELLDLVPDCVPGVEVIPSGFDPVSSTELGPTFWEALLLEISQAPNKHPDLAGIVVTHGTATLEESAFVVDLFSNAKVPLVFSGAQRPANAMSSDAAFNLSCAIAVAASDRSADKGVLVVMNGEIHAAADVSKQENFALDAFKSNPSGPLGTCDGTTVTYHREQTGKRSRFQWLGTANWPRVDIIMAHAGSDGVLIDATIDAGAKGIILVGLAPGYATPDQWHVLQKARDKGVAVVMSSRAATGSTRTLQQNRVPGLIGSGHLNPAKARLLLAAGLMTHQDNEGLFALFRQYD